MSNELTARGDRATTEPAVSPVESALAEVMRDPDKLAALPVEKMERMLALYERMQAERARAAYFDALAEFQRRCPVVHKMKGVEDRNSRLMYRFAPLEDIVEVVRTLEQECGFAHRFEYEPAADGAIIVTCVVTHREGHSERTPIPIPATKGTNTNASQNAGIQAKYGMRYAFIGAFGISTADPDTDGIPLGGAAITNEQAADLQSLIDEAGADRSRFLAYFKVESLADLPASRHAEAVQMLERKRRQS